MPGIDEQTAEGTLAKIWDTELDEAAVSISWAASGQWLAAASASGAIYLFSSEGGEERKRWSGHRFGASAVAWNPKEDLLASAGQDAKVHLWAPESDAPVATLDCGTAWVEHIAWSPSGEHLITGCGRVLRLWSTKGELLQTFEARPNTIAGIAWRSDSEEMVSACYGQVAFWDLSSSSPKRIFEWKGSMLCLAWSPDGRFVCHGNQDSTVHIWIVATGKELQMTGYPLKVTQICWERRSKNFATAGSPAITVWDCSGKGPAGRKPQTLKFHRMPILAMRYQPDGSYLASGCAEGRVAVWQPSKRKVPDLTAHLESPITDLAWCAGTRHLAAATEDGRVIAFQPGSFS
jgi:WD40 repeat protein